MEKILDVLTKIGNFFTDIIDFVVDFFQDLVYVIKLTGEAVAKIPEYIGWIPSGLLAMLIALFAVVAIYKILGREG